jgi:hypothetical protein
MRASDFRKVPSRFRPAHDRVSATSAAPPRAPDSGRRGDVGVAPPALPLVPALGTEIVAHLCSTQPLSYEDCVTLSGHATGVVGLPATSCARQMLT